MNGLSIGRRKTRASAMRMVGWLAVSAMLAVAILGPAASSTLAAPVITNPPGNPTCEDLGYSLSFKIDTGDLEEATYGDGVGPEESVVATNWDGQEITLSNVEGQSFDWSSTLPVSAVLVKAGVDNNALYTYDPAVTSDTGLTHGAGQQGISHLLFCGDEPEEPSEAPSEAPSEEPSEAPSEEPSEAPSEEPSGSEEPIESDSPAPSFSQGVGGITSAPSAAATLPPTDGIGDAAAPAGDTWRMLLVVMAALLASILVLTPGRSTVRR
jgi:hypothetical protein